MALDPLRCLFQRLMAKLLHYHQFHDLVGRIGPWQQPLMARFEKLLGGDKWVAAFLKGQHFEAMLMLLRTEANPLQDGFLEVSIVQEVSQW